MHLVPSNDTNTAPSGDRLLTPQEAAQYLGLKVQTLADWRTTGRVELPYHHVGRLVRYRVSDLETYLASTRRGA